MKKKGGKNESAAAAKGDIRGRAEWKKKWGGPPKSGDLQAETRPKMLGVKPSPERLRVRSLKGGGKKLSGTKKGGFHKQHRKISFLILRFPPRV